MNPTTNTTETMPEQDYEEYLRIIRTVCYSPFASFTDEHGVFHPNSRFIEPNLQVYPDGHNLYNPDQVVDMDDFPCVKLIVEGEPPHPQIVTGYRLPKSAFRPRRAMLQSAAEGAQERSSMSTHIQTWRAKEVLEMREKLRILRVAAKKKQIEAQLRMLQEKENEALLQDGEKTEPEKENINTEEDDEKVVEE